MYEEFTRLNELLEKDYPSLSLSLKQHFGKTLLLAAASYFEARLTETVRDFPVTILCSQDHPLVGFVDQAIARKYHGWFNWDSGNAHSFFRLFGAKFVTRAKMVVSDDAKLNGSIRDFLEVGRERNRLIHGDFASFSMQKTTREVYDLYSSAKLFVSWVPDILRQVAEEGDT